MIDFYYSGDYCRLQNPTMTAAGSPRKKEEKSREDKINEIINNIVEGNPPLGVCQNLGFCSDVTTTTPPPSKKFKTQ